MRSVSGIELDLTVAQIFIHLALSVASNTFILFYLIMADGLNGP